jgi:predicted amidohydrolase YtcJ
VLDRQLFDIPATEISEVRVLLTILAGDVIYSAE